MIRGAARCSVCSHGSIQEGAVFANFVALACCWGRIATYFRTASVRFPNVPWVLDCKRNQTQSAPDRCFEHVEVWWRGHVIFENGLILFETANKDIQSWKSFALQDLMKAERKRQQQKQQARSQVFLARMQCNGHRPMILSTVIFCAGLLALWRLDTGTLVGTQKFFTTFWGDVHRAAKIWKGQFPSRATLPAKWWQPDIVSLLVKYDFAILSSNAEEMLIEENGDQKYIQETKEMIAASFVSAHLFLVLARVASSCCYLFSSLKVWHLYYTSIYLPWTVSYESTIKADRVHVHWTRDTWIHPVKALRDEMEVSR